MLHRVFMLILVGVLVGFLAEPATANGRGTVYERTRYDEPYAFSDKECGFKFEVKGRARAASP